jgi:hypothetical protein
VKTVEGHYDTTEEYISQLDGVVLVERHLSQIGPISYPYFVQTRNTYERAINAINGAARFDQKNLELWVIELVSCTLLVIRDKRKFSEYFDTMKEVITDESLEDMKVRYPELWTLMSLAPSLSALNEIKASIRKELRKGDACDLRFKASEASLEVFVEEWKKRYL